MEVGAIGMDGGLAKISESTILWNTTAREKSPKRRQEWVGNPGEMGVLVADGSLTLSWLAYPLYLVANECQRLSCVHPVKLLGRWQVQV